MSRRKKEKVQVGNFLLGLERNSKGNWLAVSTVSGEWQMRYGESHLMYGVLGGLVADERCHKYVHALLTMIFTAAAYPHDMTSVIEKQELPVINGFCKLVDERTQFETSLKEKMKPEDDDAMLDEVAEVTAVQEELERINAEGNGK